MPDTKPSEPTPAEFADTAGRAVDAGIADETAAYDKAVPTEGGKDEAESEAQPS